MVWNTLRATLVASMSIALASLAAPIAYADTFPPVWGVGTVNEAQGPIHFAPAPWPNEPANPANCSTACGDWKPYTRFQGDINDPRVQDPSNGGTAPQNYVNVSSSCIDKSYPSIYYHLYQHPTDPGKDVIMFRWRVEQIAHNYATGPSAGNYSATDPWSSGLWTVLFDIDGDGYRDLAAHLNGSSGDPSHPIDMIAGIWGALPTQSVDYLTDPSIKLIAHNPTAFVSGSTILNFNSNYPNAVPSTQWPSGVTANSWDYGTTRAKLVSTNACNEYFIDYQIPVRMLDASSTGPNPALNGPKITRNTPISMLFCTANSLNNPFQKDCSLNRNFLGDASKPGPFGDYLSFNKTQPYSQPIVSQVTATGPNTCPGNYTLMAKVQDTLYVDPSGVIKPSIQSVKFYYWYDKDGDGTTAGDPGSTWTYAVDGILKTGTLNTWTASWDATNLLKGKYLIGVQAVDDRTLHDDGVPDAPIDNRTFSYLPGSAEVATQAQIYINPWHYDGATKTWISAGAGGWIAGQQSVFPAHSPTPIEGASENWYGNPDVTGLQTALIGVAINACGVAPLISKTATPTTVTIGQEVAFGVVVDNPGNNPSAVSLSQLQDLLPAGFTYKTGSTSGVFGAVDPSINGQTLTWTGSAVLSPGTSAALNFIAIAPSVTGTYSNIATGLTSFGDIVSAPVQVGVGAPRLTIGKTALPSSAVPGDTITYTLRYSNDSAVNVSGITLSDPVPTGLTYVPGSCTGCSYDAIARTLTWPLGNLASGEGPYSLSFQATVDSPYAGSANSQNTATISSSETAPATASASVYIDTPRPQLTLKKSASALTVVPGATVTFTLEYVNTGNANATNVVLSDPLPSGFTFVSCTGGCSHPGVGINGSVSWNLGSLAYGASGTVTIVAQASNPFTGSSNPALNTASIAATEIGTPISDSVSVGVTQSGQVCSTYYFRNDTGDIGFDGILQLASQTPVPLAGDSGSSTTITAPAGGPSRAIWAEALRFYLDPQASSETTLSGNLTSKIYLDRNSGVALNVRITVYDYDSATGTKIQIGQNSATYGGSATGALNFAVALSGTLQKNHRMLWVYDVQTDHNSQTRNVQFQYEGTVTNTFSGGSTFADSNGAFCVTPPANLVLEKSVNTSVVNVTGSGRSLTYTLNYANTSAATAATNASITDTLPASGVTFASCSVAGSTHFNRCSHAAGTVTFDNSNVGGATIPASGSGSVTVTVAVADDLAGIPSLTNSAQIQSTQTASAPAGGATATTTINGSVSNPAGTPNIVLSKSADKTLLLPGDTVTYTLTALNAGDKSATSIVVNDDFADQIYFLYGSCSTAAGSCGQAGGILTWMLGSLSPGQTATLTYTMVVSANPPSGVTALDNTASATYAGGGSGTATSGQTTVSISTNPILGLSKSAIDQNDGSLVPGDTLRYTLLVSNSGSGSASGVIVSDPIPAYTSYLGNISATIGSGVFDTINNRVRFDVGTLPGGASATLSFDVVVANPLPSGSTIISNTASVSASNAASRSASASSTATARPILSLSKTGPTSVAYPATHLNANASATTLLFVNNAALFTVNQFISINGAIRRITAIAGNSMTVDANVTASAGLPVIGAATFLLSYQNSGNADASNVVVSDPLPAGWVFVSASPSATSSPSVGSNGTVTWTIGNVTAGSGMTLQLIALPTGTGTATNTATLTDADYCAGVTPPASCSGSLTTTVGGLVINKTTSTPVVSAGGIASWTVTATNTLATPLAGVEVTDILPAGFTYAATGPIAAPGATRTGTVDPALGDSQPTWGTWTLPAGGSLAITFTANVGTGVGPATYQNDATAINSAGAGVADFDPLVTSAEDVTVLAAGTGIVEGTVYRDNNGNGTFDANADTPLVGIALTIVDSTGTAYLVYTDADGHFSRVVAAGGTTVDIADPAGMALTTGSTDATTVTVPDGGRVIDDTGYVAAPPNQGNVAGIVFTDINGNGSQEGGDLGRIGVTVELLDNTGNVVRTTLTTLNGSFSFASVPLGTYGVRITIPNGLSATSVNPVTGLTVLANQTALANFGLSALPDLTITKSHVGTFVQGQVGATYSLTVSNSGTAPSSGTVTVSDTLPAGLSATAIGGGGWSCVLATLSCTRSDALSAGSSFPTIAVTVTVAANAPGNVTNVATVLGGGETHTANNSASDPTVIVAPQMTDVAATVFAPAHAQAGNNVSVTIGYANLSSLTPAAGVTYQLSVNPSLAGVTCTGGGMTCTYDSGTGLVTLSGLPSSLSVSQSLSFTLSFTAPASGGMVTVQTSISAVTPESDTANNTATGNTVIAPLQPTAPTPIPTLSEWSMLLLTFVMGIFYLGNRRRMFRQNP